jgi:pyrimidine deaminase RibD-like protein
MTEEERAATPCVIALCKCGCKRVMYANVENRPFTDAEKAEFGKMVADGCDVIRTTVADARSREWFCEKRRTARDPELTL